MANEKKIAPAIMENVRIVFRNFSGLEGQYNRAGDRNFGVLLDPAQAESLEQDGWNVKYLRPREEEDAPQAWLPVTVAYHKDKSSRDPRVVLVTSRGRTPLKEADIDILDWAEITNVDLIVRPYQWLVNGKSGVKAYLQSIFVTIHEDPLELKYADVPDSAQRCVGPDCPVEYEDE